MAYAKVKYEPVAGTRSGRIAHSLVCLNTQVHWTAACDGDLKTYDIHYVLTHEIGPPLGLHHPGPRGQLISYKYQEEFRTPQRGDVDGIALLYGFARSPAKTRGPEAAPPLTRKRLIR